MKQLETLETEWEPLPFIRAQKEKTKAVVQEWTMLLIKKKIQRKISSSGNPKLIKRKYGPSTFIKFILTR